MSRFIYPLCSQNYCFSLSRLVLKRNKTHDREIALWHARMRYKFRRKYEEGPGVKLSLRLPERLGSGDDNEQRTYTRYLSVIIIPAKESFGMPQPAVALSITNMMNLHYFFAFSPFLFFLSSVPCLVVLPIGPFMCLPRGIFYFCLRRLVLNKTHDREIALWNARMRIYFDAKWRDHDWWK